RERGPDLLARDDVVIAVADGARLGGGHVGAGGRLGVAGGPDLLGVQDLRDEARLLLLGAVLHDRRADPPDRHRVHDARCARAGQLLLEYRLLHPGEAGAAVLLRPGRTEEPGGVELPLPGAHGIEVAVADRAGLGRVGFEPGADAGAEGFFFGG